MELPQLTFIDRTLIIRENDKQHNRGICMQLLYLIFLAHPHDIHETYLQHFIGAMYFALISAICCLIFIVHSIFPLLFTNTGIDILRYAVNIANMRTKARV